MDKSKFVEVLKKAGYQSAAIEGGKPTVFLVGATKQEVKQNYIHVGLLAKKVGYKHSFGVKNLDEEKKDAEN